MNNKVFGVTIITTLFAGLALSTHASEIVSKTGAQMLVNGNNKPKVEYDIGDKGKVLSIRIPDRVVDAETEQKLTKEMGSWTLEARSLKTSVTSVVTSKGPQNNLLKKGGHN